MSVISDIPIPSMPQAAMRIIGLCSRPDTDIAQLIEAVSVDGPLSARLIGVANSAYYGQQYTVETLHKAAFILGLNYTKVVALGFHLAEASEAWDDSALDLRLLWQGNLLRACLAGQLCRQADLLKPERGEQAFLVGLLQDLAVPLIARAVGAAYADCFESGGLSTSAAMLPRERRVAGQDHAALVGQLTTEWRFPPQLSFALRNHHVVPPDGSDSGEMPVLWRIAWWVGMIPFAANCATVKVDARLRERARQDFRLDTTALVETFTAAIDQYESLRPVFEPVLPPGSDAASLMQQARRLVLAVTGDAPGPLGAID